MKLSVQTVAIALCATVYHVSGFSSLSSFTKTSHQVTHQTCRKMGLTMYDHSSSDEQRSRSNWNVLAHTERWISETLSAADPGTANPYTRKEVQYVCELSGDSFAVVASIFKRLREAREIGEHHGALEEEHLLAKGSQYHAHTLRQTHVIVLPGNEHISNSFEIFDQCVHAINSARRNAKDYVTDKDLEKKQTDNQFLNLDGSDWSVNVNCAHLHPKFGERAFREMMMQNPSAEEQDIQRKRMQARQSPYPTIVVEVRSEPPPDFERRLQYRAPTPPQNPRKVDDSTFLSGDLNQAEVADTNFKKHRKQILKKEITALDIQGLEAIFGMPAASKDASAEGVRMKSSVQSESAASSFYSNDACPSLVAETQKWIQKNDLQYGPFTAFAETDLQEVDEAFEFVFSTMAQHVQNGATRQYLMMPHFLSHSATSLDSFTREVMKIVRTMPNLRNRLHMEIFHPEAVDTAKRSPAPVVVMHWM